ncbi:hypothetical protein QEZ54_04465 [Catellatospora sp. KI3]|uniref:hypothetical protein n=1 Tax=Catellatospora sp. KI3 TaxID=3041620 RepID=UPI002482535C|nr:hypothetical protein [Catellatospora sp. KI3]MDI1460213.1 hypothetical protein [Catellatospora sp. KI3]
MPVYEPIMDTGRPWSSARVARVLITGFLLLCPGFALYTLAEGFWLNANAVPVRAVVVDVATGKGGPFITVELPGPEHHRTRLWTSRSEARDVGPTMLVEYVPSRPDLVREAGTFAPMDIVYLAACSLPVCLVALLLIRRHLRLYE